MVNPRPCATVNDDETMRVNMVGSYQLFFTSPEPGIYSRTHARQHIFTLGGMLLARADVSSAIFARARPSLEILIAFEYDSKSVAVIFLTLV